jgi:hypothetical protein
LNQLVREVPVRELLGLVQGFERQLLHLALITRPMIRRAKSRLARQIEE